MATFSGLLGPRVIVASVLSDKKVNLKVIEELGLGLFIVKPPVRSGFGGPYQLVHRTGRLLAYSADIDWLKDYFVALTSVPEVAAAFKVIENETNTDEAEYQFNEARKGITPAVARRLTAMRHEQRNSPGTIKSRADKRKALTRY